MKLLLKLSIAIVIANIISVFMGNGVVFKKSGVTISRLNTANAAPLLKPHKTGGSLLARGKTTTTNLSIVPLDVV